MMTPDERSRLVRALVTIMHAPMDEFARRDRLATRRLLFSIFHGSDDENKGWRSIWADVMIETGCASWNDLMGDVKTMPSLKKH